MFTKETKLSIKDEQGLAALLTVVIISLSALLISLGAAFLGLRELDMGYLSGQEQAVAQRADGCIEEALHRLRLDSGYSVGTTTTITFTDGYCDIGVTGSGTDKEIVSVAVINGPVYDYEKRIQVSATVIADVVTLTEWSEI